jgi:hypothetical protein
MVDSAIRSRTVQSRPDGQLDDELSAALVAVATVLAKSTERVDVVAARTRELLDGRAAGLSYAELVSGASGPLVLDVLSDLQDALSRAGSHLRRVEVRALHAEGLSMNRIARLLGVSRQRVSAVINSPIGQQPG